MAARHPAWLRTLRSLRFLQLFLVTVSLQLLQALYGNAMLFKVFIAVVYLNILWVALSASGAHRDIKRLMIVLWFCSTASRLLAPPGLALEAFVASQALSACLLVVCVSAMMHYALFRRRITGDTLFAAIVIYMLIAMLFANLYGIIDALLPGSFSYPERLVLADGRIPSVALSYFSFVTIATLGYGDIAPHHPVAQMLASIEAVVGQFYVAIVVAWLVSIYASKQQDRH